MNILLINPETPYTFWSFKNALKFVSKKSSEPPLGLLTVASMLPKKWEKKLVDMNVSKLNDNDLEWADYAFISGMDIQKTSFEKVVNRCNKIGLKVVAGGPMCTMDHEQFSGIDHFVLNEAEITLPMFLEDLKNGTTKKVYKTNEFPDIRMTPAPMWELLEMKNYASMSIQYSRGCPFNCEFCTIPILNGHIPRIKQKDQFLYELETLYRIGWRGGIFIVDDNFIGKKKILKQSLLPAMISWAKEKNYPFSYITETSINLADDEELMQLMIDAGFDSTFIGIETVNDDSLAECGKAQNQNRNLLKSVRRLQKKGFIVSGGFIVGFDHDKEDIFEKQINFIQKSGIVTAMVGLLNAPLGTRLFNRLKKENRVIESITGDNTDGTINFLPKMNIDKLKNGYKKIVNTIYSPSEYYKRVITFLREYKLPSIKRSTRVNLSGIKAFFKSIWVLGIFNKERKYYWKLLFHTLFNYPKKFALAVTMAIYGFHFRAVADTVLKKA